MRRSPTSFCGPELHWWLSGLAYSSFRCSRSTDIGANSKEHGCFSGRQKACESLSANGSRNKEEGRRRNHPIEIHALGPLVFSGHPPHPPAQSPPAPTAPTP